MSPISRDVVVWRYLPKGRVKHALRMRSYALCPAWVPWSRWCGGDKAPKAERDRLATLPECRRCAAKLAPRGEFHADQS